MPLRITLVHFCGICKSRTYLPGLTLDPACWHAARRRRPQGDCSLLMCATIDMNGREERPCLVGRWQGGLEACGLILVQGRLDCQGPSDLRLDCLVWRARQLLHGARHKAARIRQDAVRHAALLQHTLNPETLNAVPMAPPPLSHAVPQRAMVARYPSELPDVYASLLWMQPQQGPLMLVLMCSVPSSHNLHGKDVMVFVSWVVLCRYTGMHGREHIRAHLQQGLLHVGHVGHGGDAIGGAKRSLRLRPLRVVVFGSHVQALLGLWLLPLLLLVLRLRQIPAGVPSVGLRLIGRRGPPRRRGHLLRLPGQAWPLFNRRGLPVLCLSAACMRATGV